MHPTRSFPLKCFILAGLTGSGKTDLLHTLEGLGHQVLNLEVLAHHDGSAFSSLRYTNQPSSYQFHKKLNLIWKGFQPSRPVFIEQERRQIGKLRLPDWLFDIISSAAVVRILTVRHLRLQRLANSIQQAEPIHFLDCVQKLGQRLGETSIAAIAHCFNEGNIQKTVELLLEYYDHTAGYTTDESRVIGTVEWNDTDAPRCCARLLQQLSIPETIVALQR